MPRLLLAAVLVLGLWGMPGVGGAQMPARDDLVIAEVFPNSGAGSRDAAFEWVAISNRSDEAVSLAGWALEDNNARDELPPVSVPAGGVVVVVASEDGRLAVVGLGFDGPIALIDDGRIGNGLANAGDRLVLIAPDGTAVDGVSWGSDRSVGESVAPPAGLSLRVEGAMSLRVGEPMPGSSDSVAVDPAAFVEVVITEVLANAGQGQRDASFEWVELHNPGETAVELSGWLIADNGGSDRLEAGRIEAGGYLVVAGSAEATDGDELVVADGRVGNGLANAGDLVVLIDAAGREVSRVDFSGPPLPRPEEGASIALSNGVWILNLEPTPGAAGSTSLLSRLDEPGSVATDDGEDGDDVAGADGGGVPAEALVAVGVAPMVLYGVMRGARRAREGRR